MSNVAAQIQAALQAVSSPAKAKTSAGFFKTRPGQYGEGDHFIGVTVPEQRQIAKKFAQLATADDIKTLLHSPTHEHRLNALIIMVYQAERARKKGQTAALEQLYQLYLDNLDRVNNWDLVDTSAPTIVGRYWLDHLDQLQLAEKLIISPDLWERRVALLASLAFIKAGQTELTTKLVGQVLNDKEDLIHKAAGWMLREMGKTASEAELFKFLDQHAATMPRTMLRYAIERLTPDQKAKYMRK